MTRGISGSSSRMPVRTLESQCREPRSGLKFGVEGVRVGRPDTVWMAGDMIGRDAAMIPNMGTRHVRVDLLTSKCVEFAGSYSYSSFVRTDRRITTLI